MINKKKHKQNNEIDRHPYYDSDKRGRTERFSLKMIGICAIAMIIILVIMVITK